MHRAGNDDAGARTWCKNTITSFDTYKSKSTGADGKNTAMGSVYADMAAECAYRDIDQQLKDKFDYDTGHHHYKGVIDEVKKQYDKDVQEANDTWFKKLDDIINTYASKPWSVAARSRQGSLYDSCRTGLYNATPAPVGQIELYTDKEKRLLKEAEDSGRDDLAYPAEPPRAVARAERTRARRRRQGDGEVLRRGRRLGEGLQGPQRGCRSCDQAPRLLHRHPRQRQDA
jgi:hypothetical protein